MILSIVFFVFGPNGFCLALRLLDVSLFRSWSWEYAFLALVFATNNPPTIPFLPPKAPRGPFRHRTLFFSSFSVLFVRSTLPLSPVTPPGCLYPVQCFQPKFQPEIAQVSAPSFSLYWSLQFVFEFSRAVMVFLFCHSGKGRPRIFPPTLPLFMPAPFHSFKAHPRRQLFSSRYCNLPSRFVSH